MSRPILILALIASLLSACGGGVEEASLPAEPTSDEPETTHEPDVEADPAPSPTPAEAAPEFEARTYRNQEFGFTIDYPAGWDLPESMGESERANLIQFNIEGQPILSVSVLRWDPGGDLAAYSEARETAWLNSEFTILEEEQLVLSDGTQARRYLLLTPGGERALFMLAELDERYLVLSGGEEIELLRQVLSTLRLVENET